MQMLSDRVDGEGCGRRDLSEHIVGVTSMPRCKCRTRAGRETVDRKHPVGLGAVMLRVKSKPWALAKA